MSTIDDKGRADGPKGPGGAGACGDETADADRMTCTEALLRVQEFLDGELGDVPAEQVRTHFEVCERCYPHLCFERAFLEAVRRCEGRTAPAGLKAKIAALLERADTDT